MKSWRNVVIGVLLVVVVVLGGIVLYQQGQESILSAQLVETRQELSFLRGQYQNPEPCDAQQSAQQDEWYQKYIALFKVMPCKVVPVDDGTGRVIVAKGSEVVFAPSAEAEGVKDCRMLGPR